MNYEIKKVLNSSVVLVTNEEKNEFILLGKGIGYGKKPGECISSSENDQMFVPVDQAQSTQFQQLVDEIPVEILQVTQEIIVNAEKMLETTFSKSLYLVLAEHLNFAIERMKKGIKIVNRVFWEIKNYYPEEYKAGVLAICLVEEKLGIQLCEEEAANIAFHFANAMSNEEESYDSAKYAKVIGEINNIVIFSLNRTIDRNGIHYKRFITHIKFFVERYFTSSMLSSNEITFSQQLQKDHQKEQEIVKKVKMFLEKKYGIPLPEEEITYLLVHIIRLNK